jgi:glycosyltransferase involved in cell wall biosynthesis
MSKKILFISSTIKFYENFLFETLNSLNKKYQIALVTNTKNKKYKFEGMHLKNILISRSINPFMDFISSIQLVYQIKVFKPDLIISTTPKGGLIATLSNLLCHIPRIHILTGIIWSDQQKSLLIKITKYIDILNFKYSDKIYVDSKSQISFLTNHKIFQNKLTLISNGSIKGVDLNKFKFNKFKNVETRNKLNLSQNTKIILFLGRISPEKGISTFLKIIKEITNEGYNIKGLIVGQDEKNILKKYIKTNPDFYKYFKYFEYTLEPENFLNISDLVLIPSSREGFCQVAIEASACEVPVIGFNVIGLKDSIKNNVSGFLIEYNNYKNLKEKIKLFIENRNYKKVFGKKGREFVKLNFDKEIVIKQLISQIETDLKLLCNDLT